MNLQVGDLKDVMTLYLTMQQQNLAVMSTDCPDIVCNVPQRYDESDSTNIDVEVLEGNVIKEGALYFNGAQSIQALRESGEYIRDRVGFRY